MWVAPRYDMYQYQTEIKKHLDYPDHTLILAPRQTGKTRVILERFFEETDSAIFFVNSLAVRDYQRRARDMARDWHTNHMFSMSNPNRIRGRHYETIYMDELLWYNRGNVDEVERLMAAVIPCAGRIVAVSTPNGILEASFPNTVNIQDVLDGNQFEPITRKVENHFTEDLFTI